MSEEWAVCDTPLQVDCRNLISLIKYRGYSPTILDIADIAHKELGSIDKGGIRYQLADKAFPLLVSEMKNPYGKKYRLLDGRHRLLKHKESGADKVQAYIVLPQDVLNHVHAM